MGMTELTAPEKADTTEPTRERTIRFCAELAWDAAFAWSVNHGGSEQDAVDAADAVREHLLVNTLDGDADVRCAAQSAQPLPNPPVEAMVEALRNFMPYMVWQTGPESPGYHPTLLSACAALFGAFGLEKEFNERVNANRAAAAIRGERE